MSLRKRQYLRYASDFWVFDKALILQLKVRNYSQELILIINGQEEILETHTTGVGIVFQLTKFVMDRLIEEALLYV